MCWLGDWIRLIHPMHWFQSLLRSSRRLKPQISHGFLAPFEGFPDASPGVLQVWENVGIQVIMGLSTGIPMARRLPPASGVVNGYAHGEKTPTPDHGSKDIPSHPLQSRDRLSKDLKSARNLHLPGIWPSKSGARFRAYSCPGFPDPRLWSHRIATKISGHTRLTAPSANRS